jgi:hypothetical protein
MGSGIKQTPQYNWLLKKLRLKHINVNNEIFKNYLE